MDPSDTIRTNARGLAASKTLKRATAATQPIATAQPTPGPWSAYFVPGEPITAAIQPERVADEWRIDPPKGCNGVSIVASTNGPDMEGNARLIAAAPDMLAALRRLLAGFEADAEIAPTMPIRISWETCGQAIDEARAAIAKAEGRS